jgi:hypothetical protein
MNETPKMTEAEKETVLGGAAPASVAVEMDLNDLNGMIKKLAATHPGEVRMLLTNRLIHLAMQDPNVRRAEYCFPGGKLVITTKQPKKEGQ